MKTIEKNVSPHRNSPTFAGASDDRPMPPLLESKQMNRKMMAMQAQSYWRNLREAVALVVLLACFLSPALFRPNQQNSFFAAVAVPAIGFVLIWLVAATRRTEKRVARALERGTMDAYREQLQCEARLLESAPWWYVVPLTLAIIAPLAIRIWNSSASSFGRSDAMYLAGVAVSAVVIAWLNRLAASKVRKELVELESMALPNAKE
jgi:hypothetical protein